MPEDRDALLDHFRRMRAELLAAIDGVPDDALVAPTLDGWSVKDHLAHIALWDEIRASEVARISAGFASAWRMSPQHEAAVNSVFHELRRDLPLEQVRWELEDTHTRILAAIAAATDAGLDGSKYGEAGLVSGHEAQHTGWIARWRAERG